MNVINVETVENFCEALTWNAASATEVQTWLRRNLRRHILRDRSFHSAITNFSDIENAMERGLLDSAPDWLAKAMAKGDDLVVFEPEAEAANGLRAVCDAVIDWMVATRHERSSDTLERMTVDDAAVAADAWRRTQARARVLQFAKRNNLSERAAHAMLASRDQDVAALWPEDPDGVKTIVTLPKSGFRVVKVLTGDSLEREGVLMDHCVATYAEMVARGTVSIYSVRNPANLPLATLEVRPYSNSSNASKSLLAPYLPSDLKVLAQARGRSNSTPPRESRPAIQAFMRLTTTAASRYALGFETEFTVDKFVDIEKLAMDFGSLTRKHGCPAHVKPTGVANRLLKILLGRMNAISLDGRRHILEAFLPTTDRIVSEIRTRAILDDVVTQTILHLPLGVFASAASSIRDASTTEIHAGCRAIAEFVIAKVKAEPAADYVIETTCGNWPSPEVFFAYAGLLPEWMREIARSRSIEREHIARTRQKIRAILRKNPDMPEGERASLINILNVDVHRRAA